MLEFRDIQGIVFSGYQKKTEASYLLLRVTDRARAGAWLRDVAGRVTSAADRPEQTCLNLALSASGLRALGLDDDTFHTFPLEFREGMAGSETRSRTLGDVDTSSPEAWSWGRPEEPVHALLMLFARTHDELLALIAAERARFEGALSCVYERSTVSLPNRHEHFGFADGIAQPAIEGAGRPRVGQTVVMPGEFVLGYPNEYRKLPVIPHTSAERDPKGFLQPYDGAGEARRALGHNGSFLVARQLEQHVFRFWSYMRQQAEQLFGDGDVSHGAVRLASKCVGRWPSGAPLVEAPDRDDPSRGKSNEFGYAAVDPEGLRCPVGSHIRRTNPRDSLEPDRQTSLDTVKHHLLIRRGRSYGKLLAHAVQCRNDDGAERGLFFVCINANIRRQFEFVQQTWANNTKFAGLYDERDPLIGAGDGGGGTFGIPADPVRLRLEGMPRFVDVRGGEYFFLPGIRAIRFLAALA